MSPQQLQQVIPFLVLIPVVALIVWRNSKPRKLRVELMWIRPAIFLALAAIVLVQAPPTTAMAIGICAAALLAGVALGWTRGKMMKINIDPVTHEATVQGSPIAIAFILVLIAVRFGLRSLYMPPPGETGLHGNIGLVTDALLLFGVGMFCAQGLEMWLRARKLIGDSRARAAA